EALKIEPKPRACAKEMSEAQSGVACNTAPPIQNLRDSIGGHTDLSSQFCRAHIECFQFRGQVFTGMDCSKSHDGPPNGNQRSPRLMVPAIGPAIRNKSAIDR